VDGVLVVDYPPEECEALQQILKPMAWLIFLLAYFHRPAHGAVAHIAGGYVYYVRSKV
jgi:tryptophan synthase alpha chain